MTRVYFVRHGKGRHETVNDISESIGDIHF